MARILKPETALARIHADIERCTACPRLRRYCQQVAKVKKRAYLHENYWGKPIPGFGDPQARLWIVGLAPAAHGANRTGRIFTGDLSGVWLYRALHRQGFANQAESVRPGDGLELRDAYISCVGRCAPPDNKPAPSELARCEGFLRRELQALPRVRVWVALGQIALRGIWPLLEGPGRARRPEFRHGGVAELPGGRGWLITSYHPSQQNTFTKRLTEPMFDRIFELAREKIGS